VFTFMAGAVHEDGQVCIEPREYMVLAFSKAGAERKVVERVMAESMHAFGDVDELTISVWQN